MYKIKVRMYTFYYVGFNLKLKLTLEWSQTGKTCKTISIFYIFKKLTIPALSTPRIWNIGCLKFHAKSRKLTSDQSISIYLGIRNNGLVITMQTYKIITWMIWRIGLFTLRALLAHFRVTLSLWRGKSSLFGGKLSPFLYCFSTCLPAWNGVSNF